jgi:cobalamin biosynthesis protein CbiD
LTVYFAAGSNPDTIAEILELKTAEAAVGLLDDQRLDEAWTMMNRRLLERCRLKLEKEGRAVPAMESVLLNLEGRELARDEV